MLPSMLAVGMPENRRTPQNTAGLHRKTAGHIINNRKMIFRRENKT